MYQPQLLPGIFSNISLPHILIHTLIADRSHRHKSIDNRYNRTRNIYKKKIGLKIKNVHSF